MKESDFQKIMQILTSHEERLLELESMPPIVENFSNCINLFGNLPVKPEILDQANGESAKWFGFLSSDQKGTKSASTDPQFEEFLISNKLKHDE